MVGQTANGCRRNSLILSTFCAPGEIIRAARSPLRGRPAGGPIACGDWSNSACLSVGSSKETTWAIPASRWSSDRNTVVRPERFELPTTWFEGKIRHYYVFTNQSLAALARLEPSLTKAQSWHAQSGHETFPAQSFRRSAATAADARRNRTNCNICHRNLTTYRITH